MQPKAQFKRPTLHVPNLSAEFSLFYCASCARLYDLYKASVSQLIFMPGPAAVTIKNQLQSEWLLIYPNPLRVWKHLKAIHIR